jgi:cell division transport system permease protein
MRFSFFLNEAFGSMRRNWVMTMAAVLTVFISTAIMGLVLVTDRNLNSGATNLKNRVKIEVFIKDAATQQQILDMQDRIKAMPEVKSWDFVTKEEALKRFIERYGNAIVSQLTGNPLPASFEIKVKNADQVDAVAARFFSDAIVDNSPGTHDGVQYAQATVRKMLSTISLVEKGMWIATALFAVAGVLLISTTVRLSIFARRREIEIMRLVGATNWFIRWPFVMEGFVTGLLGALLAAIGIYVFNWLVFNWIRGSVLSYLRVHVYPLWLQSGSWPLGMLPTLALLGALLGAFGSGFALRRYLRV